MKKKIMLIPLALCLALSLVTIGCPPVEPEVQPPVAPEPVEVFRWRVQTAWPSGFLPYVEFVRFTERLEELTGGRLIIEPFPAGAIVSLPEKFDAVIAGVFEGYQCWASLRAGKDAAFASIPGVTMGFPEIWQLDAWFWEWGGIELTRQLYAQFGLFYVGPQMYGTEPLHFIKPVHSIADLPGLKIRTPAGMTADLIDRLGASVVILPGGEIYSALDKGLIDGTEWTTLHMNYELGLHEVAPYFITTGFHQPTGANEFAVRMDVWEALPADLQALLEAAVREWSLQQWYATNIADIRAREAMLEFGNVELELPEADIAEIRKVALTVWEDWAAKSPMSAEIIESKIEFMRFLGVLE